jgi:hypothetical protein
LNDLPRANLTEASKIELLNLAAAYRKLAAKRAEQYGLPPPSPLEIPTDK